MAATVALVLMVAGAVAGDMEEHTQIQGFLSKYMNFGTDASKIPLGHYANFIAPNVKRMKNPDAYSHRDDIAEHGLARGTGEVKAVQKLFALDSSSPLTWSAISIALLTLVMMLAAHVRRGWQASSIIPSSSTADGTIMPPMSDNRLELISHDSAINGQGGNLHRSVATSDSLSSSSWAPRTWDIQQVEPSKPTLGSVALQTSPAWFTFGSPNGIDEWFTLPVENVPADFRFDALNLYPIHPQEHLELQTGKVDNVPCACVFYVPEPVDPSIIVRQLAVIGLSGAAGWIWWTQTVPQKRLEVSRSKKKGEIKELLDDLEAEALEADGQPTAGGRRIERWLLTDWLEPSRRKEPALPMLPKGKFNSGDNPILAAGALILSFGVANALAERAADVFHVVPP
jgi:hypothetical protein